jgi:hypothetical protein
LSAHANMSTMPIKPSKPKSSIGVGNFEQDQKLVRDFMNFVGWTEKDQYEETGLSMKKLLLDLAKTDKDANDWFQKISLYAQSNEFQKQTAKQKSKDIFEAKLAAKTLIAMSLSDSKSGFHKN